ncbi:hypothetical protein TB2_018197 [Malus domestica]
MISSSLVRCPVPKKGQKGIEIDGFLWVSKEEKKFASGHLWTSEWESVFATVIKKSTSTNEDSRRCRVTFWVVTEKMFIDFVDKMPPQPEDNPRTPPNAPEEHHVDLPNVQPNPQVNAQQMAELFQAFLASQLTNQRNEEEKESEREATYLDRFLKLKPIV